MEKGRTSQALFQSIGIDGTDWLLVVRSDGGWSITRNGKEVGVGTSERASIVGGVKKFLSLTRANAGSDAACDAAVGTLLNRIEREGSASVNVAKYQGRTRPHASKASPACLTTQGTAES